MPDLVKLYSSLHTTWDRIRVDILSHAFLLGVFFVAGVTLPRIPLPVVDVDKVMDLPIYKLAKDTNALLLVPVALSFIVIVYGLVVRTLSGALVAWYLAMFPPFAGHAFIAGAVRLPDLVTIASLLGRSDFNEHDLSNAMSTATLRYATKHGKSMQPFHIGEQDKDASLYLGYAILFLALWCVLFLWLPSQSKWRLQNSRAYWAVLSLLLLFLLRSWIRVREFWLQFPAALVSFAAFTIRTDPDQAPALNAAKPRLADIEARVEFIHRQAEAQSLFGFIIAQSIHKAAQRTPSTTKPWLLRRLYDQGRGFSERPSTILDDEQRLESFAKYLFYRVAHAIGRLLILALGLLTKLRLKPTSKSVRRSYLQGPMMVRDDRGAHVR